MTPLAVYGHGSYFAGLDDPHDVDVLVVSDRTMRRLAALRYVPAAARHLPVDLSIVTPATLRAEPICRAIALTGTLLAGEPVDVKPFTCGEWRDVMHAVAALPSASAAQRVLALLRAEWAAEGRLVLPKSAVPTVAEGTEYEGLAREAWTYRHDPTWRPSFDR